MILIKGQLPGPRNEWKGINNLTHAIMLYECGIDIMINDIDHQAIRKGLINPVLYNNGQGWSNTQELDTCPRRVGKCKTQKDRGSPNTRDGH